MNPQLLISCVCGENLLYKNVQNVCCITVYKLYRKTAKKRLIKLVSKYFIFSRLSLKNIEHCSLVQNVPQINKNTAILKDGKLEKNIPAESCEECDQFSPPAVGLVW